LVLASLLGVLAVALAVARSVVVPIRRLHAAALDTARRRLTGPLVVTAGSAGARAAEWFTRRAPDAPRTPPDHAEPTETRGDRIDRYPNPRNSERWGLTVARCRLW
jgi:hypothetical protein